MPVTSVTHNRRQIVTLGQAMQRTVRSSPAPTLGTDALCQTAAVNCSSTADLNPYGHAHPDSRALFPVKAAPKHSIDTAIPICPWTNPAVKNSSVQIENTSTADHSMDHSADADRFYCSSSSKDARQTNYSNNHEPEIDKSEKKNICVVLNISQLTFSSLNFVHCR